MPSRTVSFPSLAERLSLEADALAQNLADMVRSVPAAYENHRRGDFVIVGMADFQFQSPDAATIKMRNEINRQYGEWREVFRLLFATATDDIRERVKDAENEIANWIELGNNFKITSNREQNALAGLAAFDSVRRLLELVRDDEGSVVIVPDTNALVEVTDPRAYEHIASAQTYAFALLPTVLREMDNLKRTHRDADYRAKVTKAITRIKGWRVQGRLTDGVTVDKTITVKAFAKEPNFANTLHWLDRDNQDDRIVAATLDLQIQQPRSIVIIVTGDISLQNKAEAARLPYAETPNPPNP